MKAFVLAGILAFGLAAHGQVQTPDEHAALVKAVLERDRRMAAVGDRVARAAPYVFIGRPLTGEDRPDRTGRWYQSTVLEVLEVLRGEPGLVPGTVVVTDTAARPSARPASGPQTGNSGEISGGTGTSLARGACTFVGPRPYLGR